MARVLLLKKQKIKIKMSTKIGSPIPSPRIMPLLSLLVVGTGVVVLAIFGFLVVTGFGAVGVVGLCVVFVFFVAVVVIVVVVVVSGLAVVVVPCTVVFPSLQIQKSSQLSISLSLVQLETN